MEEDTRWSDLSGRASLDALFATRTPAGGGPNPPSAPPPAAPLSLNRRARRAIQRAMRREASLVRAAHRKAVTQIARMIPRDLRRVVEEMGWVPEGLRHRKGEAIVEIPRQVGDRLFGKRVDVAVAAVCRVEGISPEELLERMEPSV